MTDKDALIEALGPVFDHLSRAEPGPGCAAELDRAFPLEGPLLQEVRALVEAGLRDGWLCPKEAGGVRFGRPLKPGEAAHGLSLDAVRMDGAGPGHVHPRGEFDLCFALEGAPRFDGHPPGWVVYPPGSWHVPTVQGGAMAILYFLPGGEIRFQPAP
jgi:hypothetical protein